MLDYERNSSRGINAIAPGASPVAQMVKNPPAKKKKKESACHAGDLGSIPGLGRSSGEGKGYPLQYSCLENPMGRGAWWAAVRGVARSQTRLNA